MGVSKAASHQPTDCRADKKDGEMKRLGSAGVMRVAHLFHDMAQMLGMQVRAKQHKQIERGGRCVLGAVGGLAWPRMRHSCCRMGRGVLFVVLGPGTVADGHVSTRSERQYRVSDSQR